MKTYSKQYLHNAIILQTEVTKVFAIKILLRSIGFRSRIWHFGLKIELNSNAGVTFLLPPTVACHPFEFILSYIVVFNSGV